MKQKYKVIEPIERIHSLDGKRVQLSLSPKRRPLKEDLQKTPVRGACGRFMRLQ
jgi:hypothetical protein